MAPPAAPQATQESQSKRRDWIKRTKKEHFQDTLSQASAAEKTDWGNIVDSQLAEDDLDDVILDAGGQLNPIDDSASPEYSYELSYEFTDEQAERMMMFPPKPLAEDDTSATPSSDVQLPSHPAMPAVEEHVPQPLVIELNYQLRPRGVCLMEPPLTQLYVWVHYKVNKLPVPEWRVELSQLQTVEVKEFQAWCLWAGNWKQNYNHWATIPVMEAMQPERYGLQGSSGPLSKLTFVLGLDEVYMFLLRIVLQVQTGK